MKCLGIEALGRASAVAALALVGAASASSQSLVLAQTIDLPAVTGRIDHLDIDLEGGRLFVAALAAGSLEVIELRTGKRIARIGSFSEPRGVAYLSARHRVVVASGGSGRVEAYERAPAALASVGGLDDADNVRFDARADRLFVGYGRGLVVLDPQTLAIMQGIELPGHPEAFELEPSGRRIFVNVPSAGQTAVIHWRSGTLASTWPVAGAAGNFPMALDDSSNRLYIATRRPALLQATTPPPVSARRAADLRRSRRSLFQRPATAALRGVWSRCRRGRAPARGSLRGCRAAADGARRAYGAVRLPPLDLVRRRPGAFPRGGSDLCLHDQMRGRY
jgi:hypothetical protein